ncbi:MAG: hypothetical protein HC854_03070 [Flavobacterium sp.]|nr:hypothetical protein [Flavobacterium sp.]
MKVTSSFTRILTFFTVEPDDFTSLKSVLPVIVFKSILETLGYSGFKTGNGTAGLVKVCAASSVFSACSFTTLSSCPCFFIEIFPPIVHCKVESS